MAEMDTEIEKYENLLGICLKSDFDFEMDVNDEISRSRILKILKYTFNEIESRYEKLSFLMNTKIESIPSSMYISIKNEKEKYYENMNLNTNLEEKVKELDKRINYLQSIVSEQKVHQEVRNLKFQNIDIRHEYEGMNDVFIMYGRGAEGDAMKVKVDGFKFYFYMRGEEDRVRAALKKVEGKVKGKGMHGDCKRFGCACRGNRKFWFDKWGPRPAPCTKYSAGCKDSVISHIEEVSGKSILGYEPTESKFFKIYLNSSFFINRMRFNLMEEEGVEVFEADIKPLMRFMVDFDLRGCGWSECNNCEFQGRENVWRCHVNEIRANNDKMENAPIRTLGLDIECMAIEENVFPTPDRCPMIQCSVVTHVLGEECYKDKIVFCLSECDEIPDGDIRWYNTEEQVFHALWKFIRKFDPDIITGFNSNGFDLPYLFDRAKTLKCDFFRYISRKSKYPAVFWKEVFSSAQTGTRENTRFHIPGVIPMDVFELVKAKYKLREYNLNFVSEYFLKEKKMDDIKYRDIPVFQRAGAEKRAIIAKYCLQDTILVMKLIDKLQISMENIQAARVQGCTFQEVFTKGISYRLTRKLLQYTFKYRFFLPTFKKNKGITNVPMYSDMKLGERAGELSGRPSIDAPFVGATVLEPHKGYYNDYIVCLDFASLYPSEMIQHNLSHDTLIKSREDAESKGLNWDNDVVQTPAGFFFVRKHVSEGLLCKIEKELAKERKIGKMKMKEAKTTLERAVYDGQQLGVKVVMNSLYGYCGARMGQIPCPAVSTSITSFGREDIEKTKLFVEKKFGKSICPGERQAEVIYGDTDSVFVKFQAKSLEQAIHFGKEIEKNINITEMWQRPMYLEYEKCYSSFLLMNKKKYVGLKHDNSLDAGKIDAKGIEMVRRDNCLLTNKTMTEFVDILMKQRNQSAAILHLKNKIQNLLLNQIHLDQLTLSKKLSKLNYKNKVPHLEVVKKLQSRGRPEPEIPKLGERVKYVIIENGMKKNAEKAECPSFVALNKCKIDTNYYLEKSLKLPFSRLLIPIIGESETKEIFIKSNYTQEIIGGGPLTSFFTGKKRQITTIQPMSSSSESPGKRTRNKSILDFFCKR